MDKTNNRRRHSPNELVSQYRAIGIPAVAAAARYQSRDRAGTRPRQQDEHTRQEQPAGTDKNKTVRRR